MKPHKEDAGAQPARLSAKSEEASAKQIIEDYLKQVKTRLPSSLAAEVIPELRSHLLEQSSQPHGRLTTASAWEAVVEMGSPDIVAREFRRESEIEEENLVIAQCKLREKLFRTHGDVLDMRTFQPDVYLNVMDEYLTFRLNNISLSIAKEIYKSRE